MARPYIRNCHCSRLYLDSSRCAGGLVRPLNQHNNSERSYRNVISIAHVCFAWTENGTAKAPDESTGVMSAESSLCDECKLSRRRDAKVR